MPTEVIMPKVDMDMSDGTIAAWHVREGDFVERGAPLFDIETDKSAMEVEAPATGRLHHISAGPGEVVPIGEPVAWIYSADEDATVHAPVSLDDAPDTPSAPEPSDAAPNMAAGTGVPAAPNGSAGAVRATPLARRIARSHDLDLTMVRGTGPRGRVMRRDVDAHLSSHPAPNVNADAAQAVSSEDVERVPLTRMRATIAARLTESKSTVPHFYLDMDCRIDAALRMRDEVNAARTESGHDRISLTDMLIKAGAHALKAVPEANASWGGDAILQYRTTDIGFAVAVDGGLFTPVVRDAGSLSLGSISDEVSRLADRARAGTLRGDECRGGAFSISNLGMYGVTSFTAIINPPQSMILAVGKTKRLFEPDEHDQPAVVTVLPVTLSCDHRVVDGATGAKWLQAFQTVLESPMRLVL